MREDSAPISDNKEKKSKSFWKYLKSPFSIFKKKNHSNPEDLGEAIYSGRVACNPNIKSGISKHVFTYHYITIYKPDELNRLIYINKVKLDKSGNLKHGEIVSSLSFTSQHSIIEVFGNDLKEFSFIPHPKFALKISDHDITFLFFHEVDKMCFIDALTIANCEDSHGDDCNHIKIDSNNSGKPSEMSNIIEHSVNEDSISLELDNKDENTIQSSVILPIKPAKSHIASPPVKPYRDRHSPVEILKPIVPNVAANLDLISDVNNTVTTSRSRSNSGKSTPIMDENIDTGSQHSRSSSNSSKFNEKVDAESHYSRSRLNSSKLADSGTQMENQMVDTGSQHSRSRSNSGKVNEKVDAESQYSRSRSNSGKVNEKVDAESQYSRSRPNSGKFNEKVDAESQYSRSRSNSGKFNEKVDAESQYSRSRSNSGKLADSGTQMENQMVDTGSQHSRSRSNSGKVNEKVDAESQYSKSRSNSGLEIDRKEAGVNCNFYIRSSSNSVKDNSTVADDNDDISEAFEYEDDVYESNIMLTSASSDIELNYASDIRRISVTYPYSVPIENLAVGASSDNIGISTIADLVRLNQSISVNEERAQDTTIGVHSTRVTDNNNIRRISVSMNQSDLKHNSDFYHSYVKDQSDDGDYEDDSGSRTVNDEVENSYWNRDNDIDNGASETDNLEVIPAIYAPKHKNYLRKSICKYRYSPKKSFNSPKVVTPPPDESQESIYFYHNKRLSVQFSPATNTSNSIRSSRYLASDEVKYSEGYILLKGNNGDWQPHYMCVNVSGVLSLYKSHLDCKENTNVIRGMNLAEKSTQFQVVNDVGFVITYKSTSFEFECYNCDEMNMWFKIMAHFIR